MRCLREVLGGFERFGEFGCLETWTPHTAKSSTPPSPSGGLSPHFTRLGNDRGDGGDGSDGGDGRSDDQ